MKFKTQTKAGILQVEGKLYSYSGVDYFIYKNPHVKQRHWLSVELITGLGLADATTIKDCIAETNTRIERAYEHIVKTRKEYVSTGKQIN